LAQKRPKKANSFPRCSSQEVKARKDCSPFQPEEGWSIEASPEEVSIGLLKGRTIVHRFNSGWAIGVVESRITQGKYCGMYKARYEDEESPTGTSRWTHALQQSDYGPEEYWVLLAPNR